MSISVVGQSPVVNSTHGNRCTSTKRSLICPNAVKRRDDDDDDDDDDDIERYA